MWYGLRVASGASSEFADSAADLLRSTTRNLIVTVGGLYLIWHLANTVIGPYMVDWSTLAVGLVIALIHVLSLHLLARQLLLAQVTWQVGLALVISLALYLFHQPEIGFLYALLPLTSVITMGWPAGLIMEGLVITLVFGVGSLAVMPAFSAPYSLSIVFGGALAGVLGWAATDTLLTATQWSLFYSDQARDKVEEARNQQLELRQIQEDLIQANRELARLSDRLKVMHRVAEEARQAKEEFVANVSHELRTPLNMIIGFSEMITQSPEVYGDSLPSALLADIDAIQRNSQHLAKLVDDVLDLSQIEAKRMALSKEWASVREVIEAAVLVVKGFFESKGLYLETEVAPDLPEVFCDGTRVRQVVLNLLSNAGRFTEQGGVRVKAWRDENRIVVSVIDTGPGVNSGDQDRLFEPFQQLDGSIRRQHGGSGLGLSISKRFVEMHGGRVWLESELGKGTTFYFSLPLQEPSDTAPAGKDGHDYKRWLNPYLHYEPRLTSSKAPAPIVNPRLVLLEKGHTLRRLLSRYLYDAEITSVESSEEAIGELSRSPAQALIVNTPPFGRDRSLANRLSDLSYGIPIVSCWVPGEDEVAERLGVVRYIVKPVTKDTLLSTVGELGENVESVLLVDDNREVIRLFSRMLSSAGRRYRVLRATSGLRALSLLRDRRPDVMLLDLIMPGGDGFQVLEEKSRDPAIKDIPVVVISSRGPSGQPIVSDRATVTRSDGLSMNDLLAVIQLFSETPLRARPAGQERPETSVA